MPGMISDAGMAELKNARGAESGRLLVQHVIAHHEGAVQQAQGRRRHAVQAA